MLARKYDGNAGDYGTFDNDEFVHMMLQFQIRRKLIKLRASCECCVTELSKKTGIAMSDIVKMESGELKISVEDARKILDALEYFTLENEIFSGNNIC